MLEKPVIIITGCSSGIGAYCAQALQKDGWWVFATVRRIEDKAALEQQGMETLIMDYTKPETIAALVDDVTAKTGGRIDALFNNGAYGQPGAVEDLPVNVLRQQFETNVFGWHDLTCRVIPFMRRQGSGRIVHCSSILGLVPYRYRGAYTASKFAVEGLGITLRMELHGSGIDVSLIEPGPIASKFTATALAHIKGNIDLENSAHAQDYKRQLTRLDGSGPVNKHKLGPDAVYAVLKHALTAKKPKPHYLVTKPAKQAVLLKRLIPSGLFYRLLRKFD
ncbi:SDR family oxidoreductase [Agrobacterium rosae]|uniref:D-beta-hydroxybutyrate dehydrogenase n=1 Tax=Agrobacterium rosae TaxID=1972867 RepID=A0A1R3TK79_9HYPH|nr:SDR family oxidoreductase [Agrobacterium rosae]MDX8302626.1 SDR family oxidoreductase [Agrobacterium rosae]POO55870.1 short-chain dehydrogenase [Agrobacterium rosae]SCX13129.1 D-beta-hydroxybutyrate dehydrogenase [Agrobacterium rosae]